MTGPLVPLNVPVSEPLPLLTPIVNTVPGAAARILIDRSTSRQRIDEHRLSIPNIERGSGSDVHRCLAVREIRAGPATVLQSPGLNIDQTSRAEIDVDKVLTAALIVQTKAAGA